MRLYEIRVTMPLTSDSSKDAEAQMICHFRALRLPFRLRPRDSAESASRRYFDFIYFADCLMLAARRFYFTNDFSIAFSRI